MAYMALAERVPLADMPVADAAALLRGGLSDRAASVREAVASRLVMAWLDGVDGEPLKLVHALNVQAHPGAAGVWGWWHAMCRAWGAWAACCMCSVQACHGSPACCWRSPSPTTEECELVLRTLLDRGVANAVHLGRMAESDGLGLRADFSQPGVLMGPASALFWRVVCEWLHSQATSKGLAAANKVGAAANIDAAAAAERLEALESAMPGTVAEMAEIIAKHAAGGARYRFSAGQLMQLAAKCMDFADAAGRSAASLMLRQLLADAPRWAPLVRLCVGLHWAGGRQQACRNACKRIGAIQFGAAHWCAQLPHHKAPLRPAAPCHPAQRRRRRGGGRLGGGVAQRRLAARAGAVPAQGVRLPR